MESVKHLWPRIDFSELFLMFSQASTISIVVTDTEGVILWCNDRMAITYDQPKNEVVGTHLKDIVVYPKGITVEDRMQQAFERGYTEQLSTTWITAVGKKKYMHQRIFRLNDKQKNHIGFWGIAYELTKEKKRIDDSRAAIRVLNEIRKEEIKEKQLEVIDMVKAQSIALCLEKNARAANCPAILAAEESLVKDQPSLKALLTGAELKVAKLVKKGVPTKGISDRLCISERTVKNHRHAIRKKLKITRTDISLSKYLQSHSI